MIWFVDRAAASELSAAEEISCIFQKLSAPTRNFFESHPARVLEKTNEMAGVFEFVNIRPDFGLPGFIVTADSPQVAQRVCS